MQWEKRINLTVGVKTAKTKGIGRENKRSDNMRYTKRIYHDRQPRAGDTIEIIRNVNIYCAGEELVIASAKTYTGDCVKAFSQRRFSEEYVHDAWYRIYTDITYVKTGEQHVVKRFLGIPYYRKTIDIYEEELTHD